MRILLADDDLETGKITKMALEMLGQHVVNWVQDGQQAVDQCRTEAFELILLDYDMPKKTGFDAAKEILKQDPSLKVILLSAHSARKELSRVLSVGAIGYIEKPFSPSSLNQQIDTILMTHTQKSA